MGDDGAAGPGAIFEAFERELPGAGSREEALALKSRFLGRSGELSRVLRSLKDAPVERRREVGAKANELKARMLRMIDGRLGEIERERTDRELAGERIDITLRDSVMEPDVRHGGVHPVTRVRWEIEDVFLSMGFEVLDGPHVEDEHHNFEALNIPADHPARDMQDTFWFREPGRLLRTHTSTVQVRGMRARRPPFAFIAPGKVFRCERTDAGHETVFHQVEGMMVDEGLSVANLLHCMDSLIAEVFRKKVNTRLRPGFFPFVEPGLELDIECQVCRRKGCPVCKRTGWVELLPCGMVHPNVLAAGGVDPSVHNGFAFGLGLDRLVMMRHGIDDIRHIHGADLRFLGQFGDF